MKNDARQKIQRDSLALYGQEHVFSPARVVPPTTGESCRPVEVPPPEAPKSTTSGDPKHALATGKGFRQLPDAVNPHYAKQLLWLISKLNNTQDNGSSWFGTLRIITNKLLNKVGPLREEDNSDYPRILVDVSRAVLPVHHHLNNVKNQLQCSSAMLHRIPDLVGSRNIIHGSMGILESSK